MTDRPRNVHPLELLHPRSLKNLNGHLGRLVRGRLWLQVLIAMALGIGTGIVLGPSVGWIPPADAVVIGNWLAFPGQLFLATDLVLQAAHLPQIPDDQHLADVIAVGVDDAHRADADRDIAAPGRSASHLLFQDGFTPLQRFI